MLSIIEHEREVLNLQNSQKREQVWQKFANVKVSVLAKFSAKIIFFLTDFFYGKSPSYRKFRAIEVIARIPYQSWEVFSYCTQTLFFTNENKAISLTEVSQFSRLAQDNETMHVVVISQIMKNHTRISFFSDYFIPIILSFFYWWISFFLYGLRKRWSFEINYLFETHAYLEYQKFIDLNQDSLKQSTFSSQFLDLYGRKVNSELEFFELVRNDELLHRNSSIENRNKFCKC